MGRKGYLQWRNQLKIYHAELAEKLLLKAGYNQAVISSVKNLLMKKRLKQDPDAQTLEDVVCLVFLEYYFNDFAKDHDDEKLRDILRKTSAKMSNRGVESISLLDLSERARKLVRGIL